MATFTETLRKYTGLVSPREFGWVEDRQADNSGALMRAIASFPTDLDENGSSYAGTVILPAGRWRFADTVRLTRQVRIMGGGHPMGNAVGQTQIWVDGGRTGFLIDEGADGAVLENLHIERGTNDGGSVGHGVDMRFRATIRDCTIRGFRQNGINIFGNSADGTNANKWEIANVRSMSNAQCGLFVDGPDANTGTAFRLDCAANDIGIFDSGFLGDTFIACDTSGHRVGFKTDNLNAAHLFLNCYSESGETHELVPPSVVFGGTLSWYAHELGVNVPWFNGREFSQVIAGARNKQSEIAIGSAYGMDNMLLGIKDMTELNGATPWRLKHHAGRFYLDHSNDEQAFLSIWGEAGPRGRGIGFDQSFFFGPNQQRIDSGTAPPTTGVRQRGDRRLNAAPGPGDYAEWVCVASGEPGTWKGCNRVET